MKKFATRAIVADLDNLAELFQNAGTEMGIPSRIALDFAYRCDLLSDTIEKLAGDEESEEEPEEKEEEKEEKEESSDLEKKAYQALRTLSRLAAEEEEEKEAEEEEAEAEEKEEEKESSKKATINELARLISRLAGDDEESEEEEKEEEAAKKEARGVAKRQALATLLRIAEEEEKEIGQQDDQALETETDEPYMKDFKEGWKEVKEKTASKKRTK